MIAGQRIRVTDAYPVDGGNPQVNYWIRGREGVILGVTETDSQPLISVRIEPPRSRVKVQPDAPSFLAFLYPSELEIIS